MTKTLLADPSQTFAGIPYNKRLTPAQALAVWVMLLQDKLYTNINLSAPLPELMVKGMDSDNREDHGGFDGIDITEDLPSNLLDGTWRTPQIWEGTYSADMDCITLYGRASLKKSWDLLGFGTAEEMAALSAEWCAAHPKRQTITRHAKEDASIAPGLSPDFFA